VTQQPNSGLGRFLVEVLGDHAQLHTHTVGLLWMSDQIVAEAATYTTHNKYKRQTSMPSAGFEHAIPAIKTHALDRAATEIGQAFMFTSFTFIKLEKSCGEVTYFA
jgi:hypothetical protein